MKVIILKDCKNGKVNDIVEVKDGYAKNFLIPKGFANPYNKQTTAKLSKSISNAKEAQDKINNNAMLVKDAIEKITLVFKVKTNNGVLHNSISKKQITQELKKNKITIDSHSIENVKIQKLGNINVKITLEKNIVAILHLEVMDGK